MGTVSIITRWHIKFQRAVRWEFWPWRLVYIPVAVYWFFLAVKARGWVFFSAANPDMRFGGLIASSKSKINRLVPKQFIPKTIYLNGNESLSEILNQMTDHDLEFPVVLKPDEGERGWGVQIIKSQNQLQDYISNRSEKKMLQEYANLPIEMGVMYSRHPSENIGQIDSVALKEFPIVIGDDQKTLEQLILANLRTRLSYFVHEKRLGHRFHEIPKQGEEVRVVEVGNHMLGMTFYNYNHLIDEQFTEVFDKIAKEINGFHIGRFDLRTNSIEDVRKGNFKIIEVNGVNSEPCHIFHPDRSIFLAWRDLFKHWKRIADISITNHKNGAEYASFREIRKAIMAHNATLRGSKSFHRLM